MLRVINPFGFAILVVVYAGSVAKTSFDGMSKIDSQLNGVRGKKASGGHDRHPVQHWVKQLRHPRFRIREAAHYKLKQGGVAAATALLPLWHDKDLDMADRVYRLLVHLLQKHNPPDHLISLAQLRVMATDKAPSLNRWALRALGYRNKKGNKKAEVLLRECLLKCPNSEVVETTVDIFYPLQSDRVTKSCLRDLAYFKNEIQSCENKIRDIKNSKLDAILRKIRIQSVETHIGLLEHRIRTTKEYLLKHRIGAKK